MAKTIKVSTSDGFMVAPKPRKTPAVTGSLSSTNPANPFYPSKTRGLPANKRKL